MGNLVVRYGCYYGLALMVGFGLSYILIGTSPENFTKSEIAGYSVMVLSSISIYFATKQYKVNKEGQPMLFSDGLKVGFGVSAIGGLFFALYNWLYVNVLEPGFLQTYLQYSEQQIRESGEDAATIDRQLQELASYSDLMNSQLFYLFVMFMTVFLIGVLFTLVTAIAMKEQPNN